MAFDIKAAIISFAPTLAAMLGGPLAGTAVAALESAFGLTEGAGIEGVTKILQAGSMTPEMVATVRAADQKHEEALAANGVDILRINTDHDIALGTMEVGDRNSARKASVDGGTAKELFILSLILLLITLGTEIAILFFGYPKVVSDIIVGRVLGLMDSVALMVLAFHYGSSAMSARKTELLAVK